MSRLVPLCHLWNYYLHLTKLGRSQSCTGRMSENILLAEILQTSESYSNCFIFFLDFPVFSPTVYWFTLHSVYKNCTLLTHSAAGLMSACPFVCLSVCLSLCESSDFFKSLYYTTLFHNKYGMVVEKQAINKTKNTLNCNTLTKHQCQTTDRVRLRS